MACPFPASWLIVASAALLGGEDGDPARRLAVAVDRLEVFAEPVDGAFATAMLARGDPVEVRKELAGGWMAIAPPEGSFAWVDDRDVDVLRDGRIYVEAATTHLHLGREGLPRPGPATATVFQGTVLRAARQPPLTVGKGRDRRTWRAVAAGRDEVRFVRSAGVADPDTPPRPTPIERDRTAERRVSHVEDEPAELPPDLVGPLRTIEGSHRAAVSRPIERWELAGVRRDYQALLARRGDAPARAAIRERLDRVELEDELSQAARKFEAVVERSRRRDGTIEGVREKLRALKDAEDLAYDAEGLLQATSNRVDGEKVFCLLNEDGQVVTYLRVPPGLDTASAMARRVGVRGRSRFNESLRSRLMDVRDLEPLDRDR